MRHGHGLTAFILAGAALASAPARAADAPPPPPPAPAAAPAIAGLCLLSRESLVTDSKMGVATLTRLQQLQQQIQSDLSARQNAIEAAARALQAQSASLAPIQAAQRQRALAQRAQALQATTGERNQQLDATKRKALQAIDDAAKPLITAAYQAHGCAVLFDRAAVVEGGEGMDITDGVLQALDAKAATATFDLEPAAAAR